MRFLAACTSMVTTFAPELHKTKTRRRKNAKQRGNKFAETAAIVVYGL